VLCVSRHTRSCVAGWTSIAPERFLLVPDTVADVFAPGDGSGLRTASGLDGERVRLTVGRIDARERYKGHDCVIAAIPDLVAQGHDVVCAVIGYGDDRPRLEAFAQKAGIGGRVRLLGGVSPQTLPKRTAWRVCSWCRRPAKASGWPSWKRWRAAQPRGPDGAGARDALADGELGTAVSEHDLPAALARLLAMPRPDREALSLAVRARFDREPFRAQLVIAFDRLWRPA